MTNFSPRFFFIWFTGGHAGLHAHVVTITIFFCPVLIHERIEDLLKFKRAECEPEQFDKRRAGCPGHREMFLFLS